MSAFMQGFRDGFAAGSGGYTPFERKLRNSSVSDAKIMEEMVVIIASKLKTGCDSAEIDQMIAQAVVQRPSLRGITQ